jgi:hypothetical protein
MLVNEPLNASLRSGMSFVAFESRIVGAITPSKKLGNFEIINKIIFIANNKIKTLIFK